MFMLPSFWILRAEDGRLYLFQLSRQDFGAELAQDLETAAMRGRDLWAQPKCQLS